MLLKSKEVAERLRMTQNHIAYLIRIGKLPAAKIGNRFLIDEKDVEALIASALVHPHG